MNEEDLPELHMSQITRACPMCGERIKATAKICPHCNRWQNKWHFTVGHPLIWVMGFLVLFILLTVVFLQFMSKTFNRGQDFGEYRNQIQVMSSDMTFIGEGTKDVRAIILGKVRNQSQVGWREILFQIEFMDKEGKMIDTFQYRDPNLTLQSKGDASFKIQYGLTLTQDQYVKHKVTVKDARESNSSP